MLHRLVLAVTGIMMMFTVFGGIMFIGSFGEVHADTALGNGILTAILLVLTLIMLVVGLRMRKRANQRLLQVVDEIFAAQNGLDASHFAERAGISLDSAREFLDKQAHLHAWHRVESSGYNAHYTR